MISREEIRQARGRLVTVDASILLAYIRASQELAIGFGREPYELDITATLDRWEIAQSTLCGAIR